MYSTTPNISSEPLGLTMPRVLMLIEAGDRRRVDEIRRLAVGTSFGFGGSKKPIDEVLKLPDEQYADDGAAPTVATSPAGDQFQSEKWW